MKTKVVYVLSSDDKDIYWEQTKLSVYSLRQYNENVYIVLIVDTVTDSTMTGKRRKIIDDVDEYLVIDVSDKYSKKQKSRILKTSVRNIIEGDFLYIDTDTVICGGIAAIDDEKGEIEIAYDLHVKNKESRFYMESIAMALKLGVDISEDPEYFNSGVIYCKDTQRTREFYSEWNKSYLDNLNNRNDMDQTPLAVENHRQGYPITRLPDIYNCQVRWGMKYFSEALVLHYLATNMNNNGMYLMPFMDAQLFIDIKRNGEIPYYVMKIVDDPKSI